MLWPNRSTFISFGYFNRAICFSMNCVSIKIFRLYRKVSGSSISVPLIVYELINARAFSKADAMVGAGNRFESSGPATRKLSLIWYSPRDGLMLQTDDGADGRLRKDSGVKGAGNYGFPYCFVLILDCLSNFEAAVRSSPVFRQIV